MTTDTAPAFERGAWNGRGALLLFVVAQAVFTLVGTIVIVLLAYPGWFSSIVHAIARHLPLHWIHFVASPFALFASVLARTIAVLILIFCLRRWLSPSASPASFGFLRPGPKLLFIGMGSGLLLLVIEVVIQSFQTRFLGSHPSALTSTLALHHGTVAFLLDIGAGALITPIAEEMVFRGLVFTALVQRTPVWVAAGVSGALFSAFHFDPYSFITIFVVGVGLALLYYRTKNIWASIFAHATINFVGLWIYFLRHP
jgi:membrane protease YdiL (CAAX protease family)